MCEGIDQRRTQPPPSLAASMRAEVSNAIERAKAIETCALIAAATSRDSAEGLHPMRPPAAFPTSVP